MNESASSTAESDDARSSPAVREGQTVAGKYLVGALLGVGGMGAVHAARDTSLDRRVALKVLLPRLVASKVAGERFLREARAATRITSEHVVKLLESDTLPDGTPLLVMEYLEGKDLRAVLREDGPLPAAEAVDYLLQALQAIAEGHTQGIVHRDVKPSNLFLATRADGTPLIKVLDFGIAKTLEGERADDFSLTSSEDLQLGSPTYMPPEQFHNPRNVDARADIWALGVTLYELISGKQPFKGKSYAELVTRVLNAAPDALESARPLPEGLERVIVRCLEKERTRRYANAAELAVALAPFGSADARLSLTRVTGLSRTRAATPTATVYESGATEATLPVVSDPAQAPLQSAISGGAEAPAPRLSRKALGLSTAALAAVLGGLLLTRSPAHEAHRVDPNPTTSLPAVAVAQPTLPSDATALAAHASEVEKPALAPEASRAPAPVSPSLPRVTPAPARTVARVDPTPPRAATTAEPKPDAPREAVTSGEPGQSALIERLIQNRH